jgi:hypothetical protein
MYRDEMSPVGHTTVLKSLGLQFLLDKLEVKLSLCFKYHAMKTKAIQCLVKRPFMKTY